MPMRAGVIDVELDIGLPWGSSNFGQSEVEKAVDAAVRFAAILELADPVVPMSVSVKLSDDAEVHALNREWREKDKPTNVLSFPYEDEPLMGDIVFCPTVIYAEAKAQSKTIPAHMAHLVVHGMLHLMGYDHLNDRDAKEMESLETEIMADLGFADPYA